MINVTNRPDSTTIKKLLKIKIEKFNTVSLHDYIISHFYDNGSSDQKNCVGIVMFKAGSAKERFIKYCELDNFSKLKLMFDKKEVVKIK